MKPALFVCIGRQDVDRCICLCACVMGVRLCVNAVLYLYRHLRRLWVYVSLRVWERWSRWVLRAVPSVDYSCVLSTLEEGTRISFMSYTTRTCNCHVIAMFLVDHVQGLVWIMFRASCASCSVPREDHVQGFLCIMFRASIRFILGVD